MLSFGSSYCQVANELFNPNDSTAPKPLLGIRLGANFQGITGSDWVQAVNTGVVGGFYAGMHKNKVGVQLEILASTTKYKSKITIDTDGNIANFNVTYLNIPLLLNYISFLILCFRLGPNTTI